MIVKKTEWLELRVRHKNLYFINKKNTLLICFGGVVAFFDLPKDVKRIRFIVYNKPTKISHEIYLGRTQVYSGGNDGYMITSANYAVEIDKYLSDKTLRQLGGKNYHIECEYECYSEREYEIFQIFFLKLFNSVFEHDANSI